MSEDNIEELLDEERPDTWKASDHGGDGATIIGTLVGWQEGATEQYGMKDIALIQEGPNDSAGCECGLHQDGHVWGLWMLSTVLINEWAKADPQVGERIGARFLGKVTNPKGNDYQKWRVEVAGRKGSAGPKHMGAEIAAAEAEAEENAIMAEQVERQEQARQEQADVEPRHSVHPGDLPIAELQLKKLTALVAELGVEPDEGWKELTRSEATMLIRELDPDTE